VLSLPWIDLYRVARVFRAVFLVAAILLRARAMAGFFPGALFFAASADSFAAAAALAVAFVASVAAFSRESL
jgi:4-aminobutyrate aminotransferase-like enzyme